VTHLQVNAVWRKSSRCESGTCVEVAVGDGVVAMRDAKNVDGPVLTFTDQAWATFLDGIRIGEFETH
jgi:hypothetical protein